MNSRRVPTGASAVRPVDDPTIDLIKVINMIGHKPDPQDGACGN